MIIAGTSLSENNTKKIASNSIRDFIILKKSNVNIIIQKPILSKKLYGNLHCLIVLNVILMEHPWAIQASLHVVVYLGIMMLIFYFALLNLLDLYLAILLSCRVRDGNRCPQVRVSHYSNSHPNSSPEPKFKPKGYSGDKITPTPTSFGFGFFHQTRRIEHA
jgi:hypothetical protein